MNGKTKMEQLRYCRELYSKTALLKAAYNYTDKAYVHLDADDDYYYVSLQKKEDTDLISEEEFTNEMLAQSVRHEVYKDTKNIRELMLARAMATSILIEEDSVKADDECKFSENEILKDWFSEND